MVILDSPPPSTIFPPSRQKMNQVIKSRCTEYTQITLLSEVGRLRVDVIKIADNYSFCP